MPTYSSQQIAAVQNNPNEYPPKTIAEMILDNCFILETLVQYGLKAPQKAKVEKLLEQIKVDHAEDIAWNRCLESNVTMDIIQGFIDLYPISEHVSDARSLLIDVRNRELEEEYNKLLKGLGSVVEMQEFIKKHKGSTYAVEVDKKLREVQVQQENNAWFGCSTIAEYEEFIKNYPSSTRVSEAQRQIRMLEGEESRKKKEADENAWGEVLNELGDNDAKKRKVEEYINKGFIGHKTEAEAMLRELNIDPLVMNDINRILNDPDSVLSDFIRLCKKYPVKMEELKDWMIRDMRINPCRYPRSDMYDLLWPENLLEQSIFTEEELIAAKVLPRDMLKYIKTHKNPRTDDPEPEVMPIEDNFTSSPNTTDVYFFGVPGSGKTTVLAGLMSLTRVDNIRFKVESIGEHKGYNYANSLTKYIGKNVFPPRTRVSNELPLGRVQQMSVGSPNFSDDESETDENQDEIYADDKFIQIIDAVLTETIDKKSRTHQLAIIEMPGERTLQFAGAAVDDLSLLGKGTETLFKNDNKKVMFFVIDPDDEKAQDVIINGEKTTVTQAAALTRIAELILKQPELIKKINSIHLILTKSDLLKDARDRACVDEILAKSGYVALVDSIKDLCDSKNGSINIQCGHIPYLFAFCLGKVLPGDMVRYKDTDSAKLMKVICENTYSVRERNWWDTFVDEMNK